jgi:hypothetical protein
VPGETTEEKARQEEKGEHYGMSGWWLEIIFSIPC